MVHDSLIVEKCMLSMMVVNNRGEVTDACSFMCVLAVRLGPKLSETVKGKLSLGARIIQGGGRENIFKHMFSVREGEELLKASQCYLSTTAGPIAGLLFISTEKVAFCSERSISFTSPSGDVIRSPYKVYTHLLTFSSSTVI